jgi:Major intrinsic protein
MVMVYATGYVSGGDLNPAVTLAVWKRGKLPTREVLPYCAVGGGDCRDEIWAESDCRRCAMARPGPQLKKVAKPAAT